jgi:hypothetical protein
MPTNKPAKPKKPKAEPKKSLIETAPEEEIELSEADFIDDFEHEPQYTHVERVDFAAMCEILHALHLAYMPGDDDEPNERFLACWHSCLAISGWAEGDFWECYDGEDPCPICGADQSEFEDDDVVPLLPAKPDTTKLN